MTGSFSDSIQWLSKQNGARLKNSTQIVSSYLKSRYNSEPIIRGLPISISIEPTTSCNLRCPECPSGLRSFTRPTGMMMENLFTKVIDELAPTLSYLIFYFQGEPYLHPQFLKLVKYASERKIYTATSTNAHYLNDANAKATIESGLDRLIISIDGATQQTYEAYRKGGNLEKVMEGTRNIVKWKKELKSKTPHTIFQFLVVKPNEHEIADVKKIAKELGVDKVVFKTAQIYDYENGSELIPTVDHYSRYKRNSDGRYVIKNQMLDHCWKMWHSCVITWDGKVVPCCFDKDAHFVLGDLNTSSFKEIWTGEKYRAFRAALIGSRSEIDMCRNCTEGTKVWA